MAWPDAVALVSVEYMWNHAGSFAAITLVKVVCAPANVVTNRLLVNTSSATTLLIALAFADQKFVGRSTALFVPTITLRKFVCAWDAAVIAAIAIYVTRHFI
jgi:hypothetical protein